MDTKKLFSIKDGYLTDKELNELGYMGFAYTDEDVTMYTHSNPDYPTIEIAPNGFFKTMKPTSKRFFNSYHYIHNKKIHSIFNRRYKLDKSKITTPTKIYYKEFPYKIHKYEFIADNQLFVPKNLLPSEIYINDQRNIIDYSYATNEILKKEIEEFFKVNKTTPFEMNQKMKDLFELCFSSYFIY